MCAQFDWQTEEDIVPGEVAPEHTVGARGRWWWLVVVVILLVVVAGLVYWRVDQQVRATTADVKADVLASHNLVRQAAFQGDAELLQNVLSGIDPVWTRTQERLLADGLFFERAAFGLHLSPIMAASVSLEEVVIDLSAGLHSAEVTSTQAYVIETEAGEIGTIPLRHTTIHRRGATHWLLAPPEAEFWGEWVTATGQALTLSYPQRDAVVATQLAADLDALLLQMCRELPKINCPTDLRVNLSLDSDPATLAAAADPVTMFGSGYDVNLPAPTLVAWPLDDAGYEALRRGYGALLLSAVVTRLVDYDCCTYGLIYSVLLDRQLSQLGLRPWPLAQTDYDLVLENWLNFSLMQQRLWQTGPRRAEVAQAEPLPRQLYTLVEFLLAAVPEATVADLQRQLGQRQTYSMWLRHSIGDEYEEAAFIANWQQFVYRQTTMAQAPLPTPLPEEQVRLICTSEDRRETGVFWYDAAADTWSTQLLQRSDLNPGYIYPMWTAGSYVIHDWGFVDGGPGVRISVWLDGEQRRVLTARPDAGNRTPYVSGFDPNGRYLVITGARDTPTYELIDLETCSESACPIQPLPDGPPIWSPDGRQTLILGSAASTTGQTVTLLRGDADGRPLARIGEGTSPIWLDNERYGYVRRSPLTVDDLEFVVGVAGEDRPTAVASMADLVNLIPAAQRPAPVELSMVVTVAASNRQNLLVRVSSSSLLFQATYFFLLELAPAGAGRQGLSLVFQAETAAAWGWLSPDSRWLIVFNVNQSRPSNQAELVNLESRESRALTLRGFGLDWSSDGNWLAYNGVHGLTLLAPDYDYERFIFHRFVDCHQLTWAERD